MRLCKIGSDHRVYGPQCAFVLFEQNFIGSAETLWWVLHWQHLNGIPINNMKEKEIKRLS